MEQTHGRNTVNSPDIHSVSTTTVFLQYFHREVKIARVDNGAMEETIVLNLLYHSNVIIFNNLRKLPT